ncbi:MAG: hypothetical protein M9938_02880 [Solirubrobacterales bacterium]|nr:hypothetical protein [Solirubrobacterales bacterium]
MSSRAVSPDGAGGDGPVPADGPPSLPEDNLPPVTAIGMTSLALIVIGGIYLASHLPNEVPLTPAIVLLVLSAGLLAGNMFALSRVKEFNWTRFFQVGRWALLAYAITAGLIEYAFLRNGLSGGPLVVLTLSIVIYAVHVPVLIAFTTARYA